MPKPNPSILRYIGDTVKQEATAWKRLLHAEWRWMLLLAFGLVMLIAVTRPVPPNDVYLAVGEAGSIFEKLGQKFVPYFAKEGIELHLVNTAGSASSLAELADKDVQVNAALMVGGVAAKGKFPHLESLGSIEYVPLWLVSRGEELRGKGLFAHFSDKRVAVGVDGSAERIMVKQLLELNGLSLDKRPNFLKIASHEATEKLISGEIDAVCLMDGIDSPNVQKLLARQDIRVANFAYAPAYVKKLPFLSTVVIPMGALDMENHRPDHDIQMLASTVTLLVENDVHPVIQQIFLLAADRISSEVDQFFANPDFFPAYVDHAVKLSPVAKRFYENGPPSLRENAPLWLINYVDRMWFLLLSTFAVVFPLIKMFPGYRRMRAEIMIGDAYDELYELEKSLARATTGAEVQRLIDALNSLEADSSEEWTASIEARTLFGIYGALDKIRSKAIDRKLKIDGD